MEVPKQECLDAAVQAELYMQDEHAFIAHQDRPYAIDLCRALHVKKITRSEEHTSELLRSVWPPGRDEAGAAYGMASIPRIGADRSTSCCDLCSLCKISTSASETCMGGYRGGLWSPGLSALYQCGRGRRAAERNGADLSRDQRSLWWSGQEPLSGSAAVFVM